MAMQLAIMQPYFFPYLGYFQLINSVDKFIIYDDVFYIKQGWINRNKLLLSGKEHSFVVPVMGASSYKRINEVKVDYNSNWERKFLKTLEQAYKRAPYFSQVYDVVSNVVQSKSEMISDLAFESITQVCHYLNLEVLFARSSKIYSNQGLKGVDRVIDICTIEQASHYINPIGGQILYKKEDFLQKNIQLHFIKPNLSIYQQFNSEFIPWLSIIDILMFNSPKEVNRMLEKCEFL